jgi:Protein of unknown function (DUF3443)
MTKRRFSWLLAFPVVVSGCAAGTTSQLDGGGGGTTTGGPDGGAADNVVPLVVDNGPAGAEGAFDVPFVSVTICVPGTTTCQTIDHITVDTGSSGLRIVGSVLNSTLSLPSKNASTGSPLAECGQFADGYTWGSVRLADVKLAGEVASSIPLQIIGDPAFTAVPSDCSASGSAQNTVADLGSNGLLGINQIVADCGDYCASTNPLPSAAYYSCPGNTNCTAVAVPVAEQIPNPIASFTHDNNGAVMEFGTVAAAGAPTLSGSLIFGIGTQANNALGSAVVLTLDPVGNFTTTFNGLTLSTSFIDSGTNTYAFDDSSIPQCTTNQGFFCPTSVLSLSATNIGLNKVSSNVAFTVASADTLFSSNDSAFDDIATPGIDKNTFDWGFPFFIGRSVFIGLQGASTPGGPGPFVAY